MENFQNQPVSEPQPILTAPTPAKRSYVFGINMFIFAIYYALSYMAVSANEESMLLLGLYIPHALILLFLSFFNFYKKENRTAAILGFTALTLLVIGFGACAVPFFNGTIRIEI